MGRFYSQKAVQMFLLYQRKDGYIGKRAVETYRRKKKKKTIQQLEIQTIKIRPIM